jgi:pimeloyl-ACP methyl ester carboxylesterase
MESQRRGHPASSGSHISLRGWAAFLPGMAVRSPYDDLSARPPGYRTDNNWIRRCCVLGYVTPKSWLPAIATVAVFAAASACTSVTSNTSASTHPPASASPRPVLADPHPCPGASGFTCSTLTVPLDHSGHVPGTLRLQVAAGNNAGAPRGVLLFLTGGPGQPGVPFVPRIRSRLAPLFRDYRLVMFDQRGTGQFGAINCQALQQAVGSSDITVPPPAAVRGCAHIIGPDRRFYSTMDTVADIDALREALGARTIVLDGVSYGTYVAERYALSHPGHVSKLVLDSILPQVDPGRRVPFYLVGLRAVGRVLRSACRVKPVCGFDPAKDVAWLVRHRGDGVPIFDTLVTYEFIDPTYRDPDPPGVPSGSGDIVGALHAARHGHPAHLDQLIKGLSQAGGSPQEFSSGLHAATFCTDLRFPWGSDAVAPAERGTALAAATARLTRRQVFPFDAKTAAGDGIMQTCLDWPVTPPAPTASPTSMLRVPALLLAGDRDLSTPLEWAREEAAHAPLGKLVIVPGAAHSIQSREPGDLGRKAVFAFLLG